MVTNRLEYGLFPTSPAPREMARTILPLKAVQCRFLIRGGLVEMQLTQVYRLEDPRPLNCEYLFPLPDDASVYLCQAFINDRSIIAQVQDREAARALARRHQAEGRRTVLMEAERANLFRLALANLQPGDLIEVSLAYVQPVRRVGDQLSVTIPFNPGIRYFPGKPLLRSNSGKGTQNDTDLVPDASRISPPRIDAGHPDAAFIDVQGELDSGGVAARSLSSPSHELAIGTAGGNLTLTLARKDEVPAGDFILRWQEPAVASFISRAWWSTQGEFRHALIELRAPATGREIASPLDTYFLIDRSGSMAGIKWTKAVAALQGCVRNLDESDRAMITLFESDFQDFAEKPLSRAAILKDPNFLALEKVGTGGGTELANALRHVLGLIRTLSAERRAVMVLITDAAIGNEQQILGILQAAPDVPVHCFGIDMTLNDSLLLDVIRQQGGTFQALHPNDDIAGIVQKIGRGLRSPVLHNLQIGEGWELAVSRIPDLYAGQVQYLSARSDGKSGAPEIRGIDAEGAGVPLPLRIQDTTTPGPYLHWCKARLHRLLAEKREAEATQLSIASNLICPLTAFVAWDAQEQVAIASEDLVQPSLETCAPEKYHLVRYASCPAGPSAEYNKDARLGVRSGFTKTSLQSRLALICAMAGQPEWLSKFGHLTILRAPLATAELQIIIPMVDALDQQSMAIPPQRGVVERCAALFHEAISESDEALRSLAKVGIKDPLLVERSLLKLNEIQSAIERLRLELTRLDRMEKEMLLKLEELIGRFSQPPADHALPASSPSPR